MDIMQTMNKMKNISQKEKWDIGGNFTGRFLKFKIIISPSLCVCLFLLLSHSFSQWMRVQMECVPCSQMAFCLIIPHTPPCFTPLQACASKHTLPLLSLTHTHTHTHTRNRYSSKTFLSSFPSVTACHLSWHIFEIWITVAAHYSVCHVCACIQ